MNTYHTLFFEKASEFIAQMPDADKVKVLAMIKIMETDFEMAYTRTLRGAIRELKVKKYRLLIFTKGNVIYWVDGFVKKSQKTPKTIIENAEALYKMIE